MKLIFLKYILTICILMSISCNTNDNIDKLINHCDTLNLSPLKGTSIVSRGKRGYTYFLSSNQLKCSYYILQYNSSTNTISNIDNGYVLNTCGKDYFSTDEITQKFNLYKSLNIGGISVDSVGNIYLSTIIGKSNIVRIKDTANSPLDLTGYIHYRDNWYIFQD